MHQSGLLRYGLAQLLPLLGVLGGQPSSSSRARRSLISLAHIYWRRGISLGGGTLVSPNEQLLCWAAERGCPLMFNYASEMLDPDVEGVVRPKRLTGGVRFAEIRIQACIPVDTLTFKAVLWHEFCHAEAWIVDGYAGGHGDPWLQRAKSKLGLYLWGSTIGMWIYHFKYRGN